jgi:hypothetical protein
MNIIKARVSPMYMIGDQEFTAESRRMGGDDG